MTGIGTTLNSVSLQAQHVLIGSQTLAKDITPKVVVAEDRVSLSTTYGHVHTSPY
jgi:hypothetical protein